MFGDFWRAFFQYELVLTSNLVQELRVLLNVLKEWFWLKLYCEFLDIFLSVRWLRFRGLFPIFIRLGYQEICICTLAALVTN